jgi:hypothetical protein
MAHPPLDERALDAAVAAGVVDAGTRERLVRFAEAWRDGRGGAVAEAGAVADGGTVAAADEEQFRLLTGFNDIFVAIAIGILLWAIGAAAVGAAPVARSQPIIAGIAVGAAAWALAEYFTRRRRMALPSVELLAIFVGAAYAAAFGVLALLVPQVGSFGAPVPREGASEVGAGAALLVLLMPTGAAIAAAWAHWRRFRVPITLAAGFAVLILPLMAFFGGVFGPAGALVAAFVGGVAVFLLAMRIDASDRARLTRRTDMAFWLHLLSAPLIVHPLLSQLQSPANATLALVAAAGTILIYLVLGFIALAVDRRALLVSGLVYVMYALSVVVRSGADPGTGFTVTALIVGGSLVLLAAAWAKARRAVVGVLPADVQALVPPAV